MRCSPGRFGDITWTRRASSTGYFRRCVCRWCVTLLYTRYLYEHCRYSAIRSRATGHSAGLAGRRRRRRRRFGMLGISLARQGGGKLFDLGFGLLSSNSKTYLQRLLATGCHQQSPRSLQKSAASVNSLAAVLLPLKSATCESGDSRMQYWS